MRYTRENIYITLCVILSTALSVLADYDFRTLIASLRKYIDELEKECDSGKKYHAD